MWDAAALLIFLVVIAAVVGAWVPAARLVGRLAAQRGQDEASWFRLAVLNPVLVLALLIFTTSPPNDRYR
jgi:hypothetical protein